MKFAVYPALVSVLLCSCATEKSPEPQTKWIPFPDQRLEVRGLPWFRQNAPELWRLPKAARGNLPPAVWSRGIAPDGGRICFSSDTSSVSLRVASAGKSSGFFDVYVDHEYAGSAKTDGDSTQTAAVLLRDKSRKAKNITTYLPHKNEVRIVAIGIDAHASLKPPKPINAPPIVCYGSSVLQGTGAAHPSKTYPAILARKLDADVVNLGFGGAGKAEPQVVALVNQLNAHFYLFDLGKSYGNQTIDPFLNMLKTIRASHPTTPIFCVTPIFSTKEIDDPAYKTKSENLRALMRDAAQTLRNSGDKHTFVVEGLDLFNERDKALFHDPLHPNDEGNELIANRLLQKIAGAF